MKESFYKELVWAIDVCGAGDYIWFSAGGINGIFRASIETGKIEYMTEIKGFEKTKAVKFSCAICIENKIVFCPFNADSICEYDMERNWTQIFHSSHLDAPRVNNVVRFEECLYLFSKKQSMVISFNLYNKQIEVIHNKRFFEIYGLGDFPAKDIACVKNCVYAAGDGQLVQMDLKTNSILEYVVLENREKVYTLSFDGEKFWMMCERDILVSWDENESDRAVYTISRIGNPIKSIMNGSILFILYDDTDKVLMFDTKEKRQSIVTIDGGYSCRNGCRRNFCPFIRGKDKGLYIYTDIDQNKIIYIDFDGNVEFTPLYMENSELFLERHMYSALYCGDRIFMEGTRYLNKIENFVECLTRNVPQDDRSAECVGEKIYAQISRGAMF